MSVARRAPSFYAKKTARSPAPTRRPLTACARGTAPELGVEEGTALSAAADMLGAIESLEGASVGADVLAVVTMEAKPLLVGEADGIMDDV